MCLFPLCLVTVLAWDRHKNVSIPALSSDGPGLGQAQKCFYSRCLVTVLAWDKHKTVSIPALSSAWDKHKNVSIPTLSSDGPGLGQAHKCFYSRSV